MTLGEIERAIESKRRVIEAEDKKRASFDHTLADLIGWSVSRVHNSKNSMPTLAEAYPALFNAAAEEEELQERKDEVSAIRFRQFATFHNEKCKGGAAK